MDSTNIVNAEYYEWQPKNWKYATEQFKAIFSNNITFKNNFKRVVIIIKTIENTIIPIKFYNENENSRVLKTLFEINDFTTFSHKFKNEDAILISAIDISLNKLISENFPKSDIYCQSLLSIDKAISNSNNKSTLVVDIGQHSFEIFAVKLNKIVAHNYFEYGSADEFMFFILSFIKQNSIDQNKYQLLLGGQISMDSKIGKNLRKYFPTIEYMYNNSTTDKLTIFENLKRLTLFANY